MNTKNTLLSFSILFSLLLILNSCGVDVKKVNFTVNGVNLPPRENLPTMDNDTFNVMTVYVGEEIYFEDASEPKGNVKKWDWDMDGDGVTNTEEAKFAVPFPKPGLYKVRLRINDKEENTVSKIIYAMDKPLDNAPSVRAVTPARMPKAPRPYVGKPIVFAPMPPAPEPVVQAPPSATPKKGFSEVIGYTLSNTECGIYDKSSFSVSLSPNEDCELSNVYVWSDEAGTASIKISGGGEDESMKAALTKGRNQIPLSGLDITLKKGVQYVLRFDGKAKGDDEILKFRNGGSCGLSSRQTSALNMNMNNYLYDLKFGYRK
jgi:PKD repeat protein